MLGRQVPVLLVAGLLLLVGVNVLMDQAPRTAPQPAAGSTEMLKRIRRDLVAQRGAMDGAPGAASGVAASQRAAAAASASATASGAASPIALPAPVIFRPPMPVPGPASDAARALAQANGGASKLPPPLNTLEPGTDIFVSFSSASMAPFALNWVANLRRAGINEVLVGALDAEMYSICESNGIPTLTIDGKAIADRHAANLRFDYSAYKQMAAMKVQFYTNILKLGFNVWACDADTAWMAHPAPFVNEYPMQYVDILTTTDCIDVEGDTRGGCWHVDHNTGLVYMRARPEVLEFTAAWKAKVEGTRDVMIRDQAALNLLMREGFRSREWQPPPDTEGGEKARPIYYAWNDRLKIARLPLRYFANGHTFFVQRLYARREKDGSDHPPPFALHMTYQYGDSSKFPYGKRQRMREARVWWVDPPDYFEGGRYLAVAPEGSTLPVDVLPADVTTRQAAQRFNKEEAHLRTTLRDALGLAVALNRTLVLPRMMCYCDNIWKEMKHCKVGGAFGMVLPFDCPADHILNLINWFGADAPVAFREPGFLSDPRLSSDIKSSWVRVSIPPLSASQAREALAPYEQARVLELASAKDKFCGFEDATAGSRFVRAAESLVPYKRHFCAEDWTPTSCVGSGKGCVPFYAPCCHGAPGRHFPCEHLIPAPAFYGDANSNRPPFCPAPDTHGSTPAVQELQVPLDYPDISPNPRSRQFHAYVDTFRKKKR